MKKKTRAYPKPSASSVVLLQGADLLDGWKVLCRHVLARGEAAHPGASAGKMKHAGPDLGSTREAVRVLLVIEDPRVTPKTISAMKATHPASALDWMAALWKTGRPPEGMGRTYAERIHDYAGTGLDQVDRAAKMLSRDPETRRAVVMLGDPRMDDPALPASIPCLTMMHFMVRRKRLMTNLYFRSWDVGKKMLPDLVGLAPVLESVARRVGKPLGPLAIFVGSAHVYDADATAWVRRAVS